MFFTKFPLEARLVPLLEFEGGGGSAAVNGESRDKKFRSSSLSQTIGIATTFYRRVQQSTTCIR